MSQTGQVLKKHYTINLEKCSEEARDHLTGKARLDFSKECLMACPVCKLTTVHVKKRRYRVSGLTGFQFLRVKICKDCGNEVKSTRNVN